MPKSRPEVSAETLRQHFRYNPTTGELRRNGCAESPVTIGSTGEPLVQFHRQGGSYKYSILAKRAAWAMMTGAFPQCTVRYRNGDRGDLRWANLMVADPSLWRGAQAA